MKKVLSLMLCLLLTLTITTPSFAADNKIQEITSTDGITADMPDIIPDEYTQDSKFGLFSIKDYKFLQVQAFRQDDPIWGSDIMRTEGATIERKGCALTCVTMIAKYYGLATNPRIFNIDMGKSACPLLWYDVGEKAGYGYIEGPELFDSSITEKEFAKYAVNAIHNNKPIMLAYWKTKSDGTRYTHYVLVTGYYDKDKETLDNFLAIDPYGGKTRNLKDIVGSRSIYRAVVYSRGEKNQ